MVEKIFNLIVGCAIGFLIGTIFGHERTLATVESIPTIVVEQMTINELPIGLHTEEAQTIFKNALFTQTITDNEWQAILKVESNEGLTSENQSQVTHHCLKDINQILGEEYFVEGDMCNVEKSKEMFSVYTNYYAGFFAPFEVKARIWNGGPDGNNEKATLKYLEKVKATLPAEKKD